MKDTPEIDELLNGFIDGELTARQQTEVQRLIAHDSHIAERLRKLQKCRMLLGSLPCAEAPDDMLEAVKASLERTALLNEQQEDSAYRRGAKDLMIRITLSAAAMIGLVAVLAAVIYVIVAPPSAKNETVVSKDWYQPAQEVKAAKPVPPENATTEKPAANIVAVAPVFDGRLELKTADLIIVDALVKKTIEDKGLLKDNLKVEGGKTTYTLDCSRKQLCLLLADLDNVWDKLDSAILYIEGQQGEGQIAVDSIDTRQIAEIVNQASAEMRIKAAKYFAVLNSTSESPTNKDVLKTANGGNLNLTTIPKPVLTSGENPDEKSAGQTQDDPTVHLTIVVNGVQDVNDR